MKRIKHILLFGILLLLSGCASYDVEYSLMKSVFIEDRANPGLPIYSEWGYNTFGAYIDREVFTSHNSYQPGKVIIQDNRLNLILSGTIGHEPYSLTFNLPVREISTFEDLLQLDAIIFDLLEEGEISLKKNEQEQKLEIIDGELDFKRVQKLYIDDEFSRFILSGKFQLKTYRNNEPITIYNGRFDVGIGYENFYKL